jgi:hypothetical protein
MRDTDNYSLALKYFFFLNFFLLMSLTISDIQKNIYKHFAGSFTLHVLNELYSSHENVSTIFDNAYKLLQNMTNYHVTKKNAFYFFYSNFVI